MSARINENGVLTEELWLKHGSRGLFIKDLKLKGSEQRNRRLKHKQTLNLGFILKNREAMDGGLYFRKV
jgi:hypothetical protein